MDCFFITSIPDSGEASTGTRETTAGFRFTALTEAMTVSVSKPPALEVSKASAQSSSDGFSPKTKFICCSVLLFLSAAATLLAEASKNASGSYPYNTFVIPLSVEGVKFVSSACFVYFAKSTNDNEAKGREFSWPSLFLYSVPALCYFISNNCMFFIIRELGPTTFQITNNLKTFSTAILMRFVMSHKLTWTQVKALVLLVCGTLVTQLQTLSQPSGNQNQGDFASIGYAAVCVNALAAGLGGVYSERLLKGKATGRNESLHWQNCQLYFFGVIFGFVSVWTQEDDGRKTLYDGFNGAAFGTIFALAACGLLVSFVLKYLDNFAKCFVNALSMLVVGAAHALISAEGLRLPLLIGIVLTSIAIEQYNLS